MRRNNLAFCAFEAAGMLGIRNDDRNDVLAWIEEVLKGDVTGRDDRYSFKTKYNAARCLERLHPEAPSGYWEWIADHYRFIASGDKKPGKGFPGVSAWHYILHFLLRRSGRRRDDGPFQSVHPRRKLLGPETEDQ
jgi:hypothetical protein